MINLVEINNNKNYYNILNKGISTSKIWDTLQTKTEYKSKKSEKGYQLVAKSMAGNIARGLQADTDLSEILTMCIGIYFPPKGEEGKKCILQYMENHGINISQMDLARKFVEYNLENNGNIISIELDNLLTELFNIEEEPHTLEVQIARVCSETINQIKQIEKHSGINIEQLLYNFSKDTEEASIRLQKPTKSPKLQEMLKSIHVPDVKMSNEEKEKIFEILDTFIQYYKGELEGICRYIGTDDIERAE